MKRKELISVLPHQTHFSTHQLKQFFPGLTEKHLDYWQETEKIDQIRRGWYRINGTTSQEEDLREIANHIYEPSYISLETALRYYNFIPEIVPTITSISTRKTQTFNGKVGKFSYQSIIQAMFRGYKMITYKDRNIFIADPEKAVLDFLYYHHEMQTVEDFKAWRIDTDEVKNTFDKKKFLTYLYKCPKKIAQKRAKNFIIYIYGNVA